MYKIFQFNLAREALRYIIQTYKIKQMHIPYYLCDVVRHTLAEENCKPVFYHIYDNFYPASEFPKDDFILYPNYWGICSKNVRELVKKYPKLIVDNAHAFFDKPCGFACFNAGHKFGFKESYLWIQENSLQENFESIDTTSYNKIDERKKIFLDLHKKYGETNLLNIDTDSIPFIYPYLAPTEEKADKLVKILKKEGKTVYRYWSPLPTNFNEYKFYSKLVPIPILPH